MKPFLYSPLFRWMELFLALIILLLLPVTATTWTVGSSGCNFTSMQSAINNASTGDTIVVQSGLYRENVIVSKQLVFIGYDTGSGKPIIDGGGVGNTISVNANFSVVDGFIIKNAGAAGVFIPAYNVIIKNCIIKLNIGGVVIPDMHNNNNNTIIFNTINNNNGDAISLGWNNAQVLIANNEIFSNGGGIYGYYSSQNFIANNSIFNSGYGIAINSGSQNIIINNSIFNNSNVGLSLINSRGNVIFLNNFKNDPSGPWYYPQPKNVVTDSTTTNIWNSTTPITYAYQNSTFNSYLGNYWSDNNATDSNNDGVGDVAFHIPGSYEDMDYSPLIGWWNGSAISIVNVPITPTPTPTPTPQPTLSPYLSAYFGANVTSGKAPLIVQFNDMTGGQPASWNWSFGDGNFSTLQNPVYIYTNPGIYAVNLTVSNGVNNDTEIKMNYIRVYIPPVANFTANITSGKVPLTVQFFDTSLGMPLEWNIFEATGGWNFGDGNYKLYEKNPIHTYKIGGVYTVTLAVANIAGNDSIIRTNYISANPPLILPNTVIPQGTTKTIPIQIAYISNATGIQFVLTYDSNKFRIDSIQPYGLFYDSQVSSNINNTIGRASVVLVNQNVITASNPSTIITMNVTAIGQTGDSTILTAQSSYWSSSQFNLYNISVENGYIIIRNEIKGDFNANNRVDIGDVTRVAYMVVNLVASDPTADFNVNGMIDVGDAAKIAYYYVGKISEL